MSPIGITARFPLGVYHGHGEDGRPERLPSPARLFSALVSAAHTGTGADSDGSPAPIAANCLDWLEGHAPDGLLIPATMTVAPGVQRIAYRRTGTLDKGQPKVSGKPVSDGVAIDGSIGWAWDSMPADVAEGLMALCEDVPCLGENDSPVVLEVGPVEPNWRLDPEASAFTWGRLHVPVVTPGRRAALEALHAEAHPTRPPTAAADRYRATSDEVRAFPTTDEGLRAAAYRPISAALEETGSSPWGRVLVLLIADGEDLPEEHRLDWCVALHRALIARIGTGAPSVLTGKYMPGTPVPANRVALQHVSARSLSRSSLQVPEDVSGAFLVMLPRGIGADEAGIITAAVDGMALLRSRHGELRLRLHDEVAHAARFWQEPAPGTARLWSPTPVGVPEVTRQRGSWAFEDAVLLSLGFIWRDHLRPVQRGAEGYRDLVRQAREHGAWVLWHRRETARPSAYVHKMPAGMVAQPYRAQLSPGDLMSPTALVAIGQSRHLGGGLLLPVDMPAELAEGIRR